MVRAVEDAGLIEASLADPAVFAGLYDRHAPALAAYLIRRLGVTDGDAQLGELFRIAFESRDRYQLDRVNARPWLYGIAANLVMKHLRAEGRHRNAIERLAARRDAEAPFDDKVTDDMVARDTWLRVAAAIDDLPEGDREVLLLYAWERLTYAEIAEALGIPSGTVRSRLSRVRAVLRELVVDDGEEPDIPGPSAWSGSG
jgi:RNA polymerase sigma-70 factor (ECF subfamily)